LRNATFTGVDGVDKLIYLIAKKGIKNYDDLIGKIMDRITKDSIKTDLWASDRR